LVARSTNLIRESIQIVFQRVSRRSYDYAYAKSRREASGTYMAHNGQCRRYRERRFKPPLQRLRWRLGLKLRWKASPLFGGWSIPHTARRVLEVWTIDESRRSARQLSMVNGMRGKAFYTREFQIANGFRIKSQNIKPVLRITSIFVMSIIFYA